MMKKRKILGRLLVFSGLLSIIAAVLLVEYNLWDDSRALSASEGIMLEIDRILEDFSSELQ